MTCSNMLPQDPARNAIPWHAEITLQEGSEDSEGLCVVGLIWRF